MSGLELIHHDSAVALAPRENVLFAIWLGAVTVASVDALRAASVRMAREHPRGIAHVNIVATGSGYTALDDAARKRFLALIRDPDTRLVASATILADGGFVAATIRSVLAGLAMLAMPSMKLKFFSSLEDAETWLHASLTKAKADAPAPGTLVRSVASLRTALGPDGSRL